MSVCRSLPRKLDDPHFFRVLQPHFGCQPNSLLDCTIQTHKDPGEVEHKCIHACPAFKNEGFGKHLALVCRRRVAEATHLVRSSDEFIERVRHLKNPKGAKLWKLDAEKFYVSGCHSRLPGIAFPDVVPGKTVAEALLGRQLVVTK